jgi:hypothetical protein
MSFIGYAQDYYYKEHKRVELTFQKEIKQNGIRYYKTKNDTIVGITNKILIKLDTDTDIDYLIHKYNMSLIKELSKKLYLLKVKSVAKTLDTVNALSNEQGVVYAHPDFIKQRVLR